MSAAARDDGRSPGTHDGGAGRRHAAGEPLEREGDHGRGEGRCDPQEVGVVEAPRGELERSGCRHRADPGDDARERCRRCCAHEHDDVQQRDDGHDECGDGREPIAARLGERHDDQGDEEADQGEADRDRELDAPALREGRHERMHERADREPEEGEPEAGVAVEFTPDARGEERDAGRNGREARDARHSQAGEAVPDDESHRRDDEHDAPVDLLVGLCGAEEVVGADRPGVEEDEHDSERGDALG